MNSARAGMIGILSLGLALGAAIGSWGQRALYHRMMRRAPDAKRMLEKISRDLSLDAAQKTAVAATLEARKSEVETLKKETFARLGAIRIAADADIKKVLTPDQAAKFDSLHQSKRMRVNWEAPESSPPPR